MLLFPTFPIGAKAGAHDDMSGGEAMATAKAVKVGGQEFQTLDADPNALTNFNAMKAKLIKGDGNIQIDTPTGIDTVPVNSVAGKTELLAKQLQIEHGFDADVAQAAAKNAMKAPPMTSPAGVTKTVGDAPAPAKKPFYNQRGPVKTDSPVKK